MNHESLTKNTDDRKTAFIDRAVVRAAGGSGGDGCMSFRREKYVPKGGPDGGDGGRGGDVYFRADPRLKTLLDFVRRPNFSAERGDDGRGKKQSGSSGEDLVLNVPCGTVLAENGEILADLLNPGDMVLAVKGGRGGRGNVHFKSSTRQAPRIAERGEPGENKTIDLRLKILADVGLIGMPNAGKSTLLSRLTRAHPKIADYPFTTLSPNLGVTVYRHREFVFADIPGLIEGAHRGKGLGHDFLQHIERTRVLVHVVDPMGFSNKTAKECVKTVQDELKRYSKTLSKKRAIIAVNKMDLTDADQVYQSLKNSFRGKTVLPISGVTGEGLDRLLKEIDRALHDSIPSRSGERITRTASRRITLEPEFWVEKENHRFLVRGKKVEKLIVMTNFGLPEAVERTQHILKKMGVERALLSKGAKAGDDVIIGETGFTFEPENQAANGR